ncbi:MAG TPA: hypothetical protein VE082_06805, partial [Desulfobaccales bacterium]|nr:hypothetical protein [Desulfobaccales bacterium]
FCCMASLKQAIIAREHIGPHLDMALFYMDMRTPRKDFEKYCIAIKEQGARLIRSRVHSVEPVDDSGDLKIRYVTEAGEVLEEIFNLVVLSVGGVVSPETIELANKLGVELSPNRFMHTQGFAPVNTSRPGVFSCGYFNGPKDIPQSVMEGSAAAAAVSQSLAAARDTLTHEKTYPPEVDVSGEPPRVGVFICHCGLNIGGVADVPALEEYAKEISDVAYVQSNLFTCSQDAINQMAEMIREHKLNRVVVASCSPSTHQPLFQDMLRQAGLNKYLFEMANIRNQCTWVHQNEPELATEKCKDLIRMAVAKGRLLEPLEYLSVPINKTALVEYSKEIPDVAYVQANLFTCSQDAINQMAEMIRENHLNRVVVASCSPSTHQPLFQDMLRLAGLNKYLFEMANIRNQCTWVHQSVPHLATEKCKDLIRMAVAKARLLEPLE